MAVRKPASSAAAAADLATYADGVAAMKRRSRADDLDPLGWFYQSRIHGNPGATPRRRGEPADWSNCQHGTWFFLPWHRMYLHQLERIIRSLTGTPDFALPYWDYPNAADITVPPAFLDPQSALFDGSRRIGPRPSFPPETWRRAGTFVALGGQDAGRQHLGELPGALELNPHNLVHGRVGGDMATFQSPLDALFWIHHANIDRLWTVWAGQPGRTHPTSRSFLDTTFEFPDPAGRKRWRVRDVLDTEALGYTYQPPARIGAGVATVADMGEEPRRDDDLTLLAASATTRQPKSVRERTDIDVGRDALNQAVPLAAASDEPVPMYLRLENVGIEGGDASSMWNVFARTGPRRERHLVGTIAPFGLAALTAEGGRQTLTFDITDLSRELIAHPERLIVSFEAVDPDQTEGEPFYERAALYTIAD